MTKKIQITVFGIKFDVEVEYEDNAVTGVLAVYCDGTEIKCDTLKFYDELEDILQEEFEEALRDEAIAAAEMRYDAAKEDGGI